MIKYRIGFVFLFILIFGSLNSCQEIRKFEQNIRRAQGQVRKYSRVVNRSKRAMKIQNNNKGATTESPTEDELVYGSAEQKNMINSYDYLFDAINGKSNRINSSNFEWDSIQRVYYVKDTASKKINPEKEVFGWHPYWMKSSWENYPFELLSTISYFTYKVNPYTGLPDNPAQIQEWKTTAMIDSALQKNTKVLLNVSSHGIKNNRLFLDDERTWERLIDSVIGLISYRNAHGVDLNFEEIPRLNRRDFNAFVKLFREKMDSRIARKTYLTLTIPAVDRREVFDIQTLQEYADYMIIMGYDYNGNSMAEPAIAPLQSGVKNGNSLSKTVNYYLEHGINPETTILALPYYGSMWSGVLTNNGTQVDASFERKVTYREIKELIDENAEGMKGQDLNLDPVSMTNYYDIYYRDDSNTQIWFDDDYTLGKKYDYALSNNLKGIGIWALGYDNGQKELWELIDRKFAVDEIKVVNPVALEDGYPIRISKFLTARKDLLITIAVFFTFAVIIGFIILLSDWKIRDAVLGSLLYQVLFFSVAFVMLTPIIYLINAYYPMKTSWIYYISFLLGGLFFYLASFIKIERIKKP